VLQPVGRVKRQPDPIAVVLARIVREVAEHERAKRKATMKVDRASA
jgi:hypothetical protein